MNEEVKIVIGDPINIAKASLSSKALKHPHQVSAVNALTDYFQLSKNKVDRKGLLVMPTGSGKTYTSVYWLMKEAVAKGYIVIWVVHRTELVDQAYWEFVGQTALLKDSKLKSFNIIPVSGMPEHKRMAEAYGKEVYVLSRPSAANEHGIRFLDNLIGDKKKVIMVVDEAHHAIAGQYMDIWEKIKAKAKNAILLGLTATPTRLSDSEKEKLEKLFNVDKNRAKGVGRNGYVYQITMGELLKSRFLASPEVIPLETHINAVKEYKITKEDIKLIGEKDLTEEAFLRIANTDKRNLFIVKKYVDNRDKYGKTIVFAINIDHAKKLCALFNRELKKYNIRAEYVVSGEERNQELIREFKENTDPSFKVLINVQIMTEGSDVPDVQTVFLTRQTSSDVLLMQMIGRALRGPHAGGTEKAFVVSFIDEWQDKFNFWLNPKELDMFREIEEAKKELIEDKPEKESPEICAQEFPELVVENEDGDIEIPIPKAEDMTDWESLYQKIHDELQMEGNSYEPSTALEPVGWYALDFGYHGKETLVVFDKQLPDYKKVEANLKAVIAKYGYDIKPGFQERFNEEYFHTMKPLVTDTGALLRHIKYHHKMPPFFTFEEAKRFDPFELAEKLKHIHQTIKDRTEWLRKVYNANQVLQNIYEGFGNFKTTVFDAIKNKKYAEVSSEKMEKRQYTIVDNFYNLDELLDEVLKEANKQKTDGPVLNADGLVRIQWSPKPVRSWYALCQRSSDNKRFQITVNKLLSSNRIDRELIKYLIFHELLHKNGYWNHDKNFRRREWQFKDSVKYDAFLDGKLWSIYDLTEYEKQMPRRAVIPFPEKKLDEVPKVKMETEKEKTVDFTEVKASIICPNCGALLPEIANFCMGCGHKLK